MVSTFVPDWKGRGLLTLDSFSLLRSDDPNQVVHRQEKAEKAEREESSAVESQRRHPNLDQHGQDFRYLSNSFISFTIVPSWKNSQILEEQSERKQQSWSHISSLRSSNLGVLDC
jgi:hypothetical protein